jgi:SH3 domain-containing YSC84-like protein 1
MVKIPDSVLRSCAGLAIFNVLRCGVFDGSLAAGSGVVLARRPDGTWSPPSSFVVSTLGAGFSFGLDIYECVMVLNTPAQVAAFTRPRVSLGGEAAVSVGPLGAGTALEAAVSGTARPMWSYIKSRGLWAGIQVDGTIMLSRPNANRAFFNDGAITAEKILKGDVAWPEGGKHLFQLLAAIDGRARLDEATIREVARESTPPPARDSALVDEKLAAAEARVEGDAYESALDEKKRLEAAGY